MSSTLCCRYRPVQSIVEAPTAKPAQVLAPTVINAAAPSKPFSTRSSRNITALVGHLAAQGMALPKYVGREFDVYFKCGRLEHGFLRVRCTDCHAEQLVAFSCKRRGFCPSCGARRMAESAALLVDEVLPQAPMRQWVLSVPFQLRFLFATRPKIMSEGLGLVYRAIATHLIKKAGYTKNAAHTGAVTLIQRFGSALNLNIHFHMLFLDGVHIDSETHAPPRFHWVTAPTRDDITQLTHTIAERIGCFLERQGLLARDTENDYLTSEAVDDDPMHQLLGHAITYRIASFSLHAGVGASANQRDKLERLCRYIARPAVSEKRLSLTTHGKVQYQLKTPYRDGTTHVLFEPLDFIARLAALVPKPRVNLTRFHGVFAPNSQYRARITPAKRGKACRELVEPGNQAKAPDEQDPTPAEHHASLNWAQRLKRVFHIDIETCDQCGGAVKIIACIEDPAVIEKILDHLNARATAVDSHPLPESRAPPQAVLFN